MKDKLTLIEWKTLLDVINVYDPNDIAHVYPEMASVEFMQDVKLVFDKVYAHVKHLEDESERPFEGDLS